MATNVDLNPGKCKVIVTVDCPCKLSIQGCELDAVLGDVFYLEQKDSSFPAVFTIQVKRLFSPLDRLVALRRDIAGRLNAVRKISRSHGWTYERGYISCRENSLSQFVSKLDEILDDYCLL